LLHAEVNHGLEWLAGFASEGFASEGFANEGFANEGFANEGVTTSIYRS
jgi:hypothetical protein